MEVIDPTLDRPVPVIGVSALYLVQKRSKFATVAGADKFIYFTPKDNDITAVLAQGMAEAVNVVGAQVQIDFVPTVSTPASLQAVVAVHPVAKDLLSVSGDLVALPLAYLGGTFPLFVRRPIPPALMCIIDGDGNVVPFSGKSISIAVTVPADRDNAYDCVAVDLNVNRAGGVEITKGGGSLVGRDLAVIKTDGDFILRFNNNANDDIPQTTTDHGSFENTDFTKVFLQHAPLGAGKKAYLYVGRKV